MAPHQYVSFQDANFATRLEWAWSPLEGLSQRWVPFGMPRLNRHFEKSIVFHYARSPLTGEIVGPMGTGVLIGVERSDIDPLQGLVRHAYIVTCHHVALRDFGSIIRVNTKDGKSRLIELEPHEFQESPDGDDVVAADITERLSEDTDDVALIPGSWLATKEYVETRQIGIGEDGFMLGMFANLPGKSRNHVAARFGNISMMAHDDLPVHTEGRKRPSHLFDMHSRSGFSGSPIFAYRTHSADLRRVHLGGYPPQSEKQQIQDIWDRQDNTFLCVLGIHSAQFREEVKARKAKPESVPLMDGDNLSLPNSMSVVVPAWAIFDVLNCETLAEQRIAREADNDRFRTFHAVTEA